MAETRNRLVAAQVKGLPPGRHSDGAGLYISVKPTGARSWLFMYKREGRRRELGLGGFPTISLAVARKEAETLRAALAGGRDPLAERKPAGRPTTFAEVVERFLEDNEGGWRNAKHALQWRSTLAAYCQPIADKPVADVDTEGVLRCLRPIWQTKAETASRVRGRIERVLAYAAAHGWRDRERVNPAAWSGHLAAILPRPEKLMRGHHRALPFQDVPSFMTALQERRGIAARALEFAILTAARSGEVRGATWGEVDDAVWTVAAGRMKAGREHRVPLSGAAQKILKVLPRGESGDFLFPGARGQPLSDMTLSAVLKRMHVSATVHGFRSSFRDWAGDATDFQREVAEAALAHVVGDAAERAYRRSDALEKRRKLMEGWADFCSGVAVQEV